MKLSGSILDIVREFAGWLVNNIDLVLAIPLMASVICLSLQRLGLLKHLRLDVYVSASLSLAIGYAFALGISGGVAAIVVIAPQTFVLVVLAVVAAGAPRNPKPDVAMVLR